MGSLCSKLPLGSLCSRLPLGSLCSKSSNHTGGHAVLSDTTDGGGGRPLDLRAATAEAAERRKQGADSRGVVSTNPRKGQLAKQLAQQRQGIATDQQLPAPLVFD